MHRMKRGTTASQQHRERRCERRWEPSIPSVLPCSCAFCSVVRSVGNSAVKIRFPIFLSLRVPGLRTLVGNQSRRHFLYLRWMLVVGCGGKFTVKASFVFNSPRGPRTGSLWPVDLLCVLELILGLCLGIESCVYEFRCSLYHPVL
jgi:hypothetical protein